MENTSAILFDHTNPRYFLVMGGKAVGPLTAQDISERVSSGQCSLLSYIWCEDWDDWKHVYKANDFESLIPAKPEKSSIQKLKQRLEEKKKKKSVLHPPLLDDNQWFLHSGGTQFGPLSTAEVKQAIEDQKIDSRSHIWTEGWPKWKSVTDAKEFASFLKQSPSVPPPLKSSERRTSPRRPLVAKLFLHNEKEVVVAVCRDISIGGMQVLTDHVPGEVGTKLKLNVSPSGSNVKGFVAEGEIVRVLEDGRGFSFRFLKIASDAKKAIETYLKDS